MSQERGRVIERVCVSGGGVIGSLFAGHLAQVADVSVLTRRREHADALNERGLRVSGRSELQGAITASSDPAEIPPFDLGILATKAPGLAAAATTLEGHFPDATMMTTLNGLGAEEIVRAHGDWPIISAVTFMSGTRHDDTHVEYILDTATWLGPYEDTPYESVEEAAALIRSAGIEVYDDPWEMNVLATQRGSAHYPSMLEDVESHRPTEIDLITGALVREADRHGVDVPLHTALYRLVKAKEESW